MGFDSAEEDLAGLRVLLLVAGMRGAVREGGIGRGARVLGRGEGLGLLGEARCDFGDHLEWMSGT